MLGERDARVGAAGVGSCCYDVDLTICEGESYAGCGRRASGTNVIYINTCGSAPWQQCGTVRVPATKAAAHCPLVGEHYRSGKVTWPSYRPCRRDSIRGIFRSVS